MPAGIIDGKAIAAQIRLEVADRVSALKKKGVVPGLAVILVGENPASVTYVANKQKACAEVGMRSFVRRFPADVSEEMVLAEIKKLNMDPSCHGILVQLPLPKHIREAACIEAIDPKKDVDGFHPVNVGRMLIGESSFIPCTPAGIVELLRRSKVKIEGAEAVVVGRSNIVGKPVALLLLRENATVTVCHTRTRSLGEVTRRADILVVAAGRPRMISGDMIKEGATVIDVGINRVDGKLVGDVDFETARERCGLITPVPGGVGPMTIAMLLKQCVEAAELNVH
ncbi:MAG TPA: bifunctional methylenetetrahydrofolate dehydrogenase/methenyltetrahydrofolate cyclohydrolase FolD [Firmicutes bacterium]|nr:bifunctional methylenetetrahydrofolate dehydrogenase/methenyltetrahydrofolate cyclohydrolase FolD [Bacillota bacterium]